MTGNRDNVINVVETREDVDHDVEKDLREDNDDLELQRAKDLALNVLNDFNRDVTDIGGLLGNQAVAVGSFSSPSPAATDSQQVSTCCPVSNSLLSTGVDAAITVSFPSLATTSNCNTKLVLQTTVETTSLSVREVRTSIIDDQASIADPHIIFNSSSIADRESITGETNENYSTSSDPPTQSQPDVADFVVPKLDTTRCPRLFRRAVEEFGSTSKTENNFLKGCLWSPDGTCLLTASEDQYLRLFDLYDDVRRFSQRMDEDIEEAQDLKATLRMKSPDLVYDYGWYPFMTSADPATCCFVATARDTPVKIYDAFDGSVRCSYRAFNHVDEFVAAISLTFSPDGSKIICGFDKTIRVFDVNIPGRTCTTFPTYTKKTRRGLKGIVSSFHFHPSQPDLFVCGSYTSCVGLFSLRSGQFHHRLEGDGGGVTGVRFSPCGQRLFVARRKRDQILCYDVRNLGQILFSVRRESSTNQRIQFDFDSEGNYVFSGDSNGKINAWDLRNYELNHFEEDGSLPTALQFKAHVEPISGTSLHPYLPLIATASGQRHFMDPILEDSDEDTDDESSAPVWCRSIPSSLENSLIIWRLD